jgi:hypothetical protein
VAAGGNDALSEAFDPEVVDRELDAVVGALRAAGADVLMTELLDITATSFFRPEHRRGARRAHASRSPDVTRGVAARHGALLIPMRAHPACAETTSTARPPAPQRPRGTRSSRTKAVRVLGDGPRAASGRPRQV